MSSLTQLSDRQREAIRDAYLQPRTPQTRVRYLYVYRLGPVSKIGIACEPWTRWKAMQLPEQPEIAFVFQHRDVAMIERALHKRFAQKREYGEWFALDDADIADLKAQCANWIGKRVGKDRARIALTP